MYNSRKFFIVIFTICIGLLIFGLYLEHVHGLEACPLCIFQRIAYTVIIFIALIGAIHNPRNLLQNIYKLLMVISSITGAAIAGRQIWLQHLPPELVPECGPGLDYMFNVFPFREALKMIFTGSGECAEVKWRFIGLSIAEWSLIMFIGIFIATILSIYTSRYKNAD
ncbi:MAG: disulfide bond formation protein B [Legionellales bacterium]|nr:disulfide bond formation protein B [Legionellales bacterium]